MPQRYVAVSCTCHLRVALPPGTIARTGENIRTVTVAVTAADASGRALDKIGYVLDIRLTATDVSSSPCPSSWRCGLGIATPARHMA